MYFILVIIIRRFMVDKIFFFAQKGVDGDLSPHFPISGCTGLTSGGISGCTGLTSGIISNTYYGVIYMYIFILQASFEVKTIL